MLPIENMQDLFAAGRNSTSQWTGVALDGQEKLARANIDALQDLIKMGCEQWRESSAELAVVPPPAAWPQFVMSSVRRGTAFNLGLLSMTRRMQQEMACIFEENLRAMRDGTVEAVDGYASVARSQQAELRRAA